MKQIVIGIFFGLLIASAIFIPIMKQQTASKFELGRKNGVVEGLTIAAKKIEKEFGDYDGKSKYSKIFSVKTTDVVVINEGNIKTIRVIP